MENEDLGPSRFTTDDFSQITPPGAAPSSGAPRNEPRDFFGPQGALEPQAEETTRPVDYRDVRRAAATNVALGAGDIVGTLGSIGQLYDTAREKVIKYGILKPAEYFGAMPPSSSDRFIEEAKKLGASSPAEERGDVNRIFGAPFPTSTGVERELKSRIPALKYEPQTPEGESVGKSVRLGTSMVAPGGGGVTGAAARFGAGAAGSQIGQGAANLQNEMGYLEPGSVYEEYAEPAGTLIGTLGTMLAGRGVRNVVVPSAKGADNLASAMARDFESGRVDRDFVVNALNGNERVALTDLFGSGTETRKFVEGAAAQSGSTGKSLLEQFNASLAPIPGTGVNRRIPEGQARVSAFLANQTPSGSLDAAAISSATEQANQVARNAIYSLVRAEPAAQAIPTSALGPMVSNNQYIQRAIAAVTEMAPDLPRSWGVVAPRQIPATGRNGVARETPGNLPFWDAVKKNLDEDIKNLQNAANKGDQTSVMRMQSLQQAKNDLLRQVDDYGDLIGGLDHIVPRYASTRARAGELLQQDNAVDSGIEYFKRMGQMDRAEARQYIEALSPEARQLARTGWLSELNNAVGSPGGLNNVSTRLAADPNFIQNARFMLGRDYERTAGNILAQNMRSQIKAIPIPEGGIGETVSRYKMPLAGASLGVAASQAENIVGMLSMGVSPTQAATVLATGAGAAGIKGAANLASSRIADRAVRLALSDRPADHVRLVRLAEDNPEFRKKLATLNSGFQIYNQQKAQAEGEASEAPRASGGRAGRATGGRVSVNVESDALVRAAERAKKDFNRTTEPLLNTSDNHIAKALEVANKAI